MSAFLFSRYLPASVWLLLPVAFVLLAPAAVGADEEELHLSALGTEVSLFSSEGRIYVGDQLDEFIVIGEEEISPASAHQRLELLQTENRDFFIRGEVYLGGTDEEMRFPEDYLTGFTVFVREADARRRYELNPVRIRNKRRQAEGREVSGIEHPVQFADPALGEWLAFSALVTADRIVFQIGDQTGRIVGPIAADGRNFLGIAPGSRLRDVSLCFVETGEEEPTQTEVEPGPRIWTDTQGRVLHAEMLASDETSVTVRRSDDGRVFTILLEVLSQEDREFVARAAGFGVGRAPEFLWAVAAAGNGNTGVQGIAVDEENNSYITGTFTDEVTFGETTLVSRGGTDIYLAKYDAAGRLLWVRQAGGANPEVPGSSGDIAFEAAIDGEGSVFIAGYFHGEATFGETELRSRGGNDIYVAKYSRDGDLLWVRQAGGNRHDTALTLAASDTGVAIAGFFRSEAVFGDHTLTASPSAGDSRADSYVARLDGEGNVLWVRVGSGTGANVSYDAAWDPRGDLFVCGYFQETATFSSQALVSAGGHDAFIAKYDAEGEVLWIRRGGGSGTDIGRAVATDGDGNAYVLGTFEETAAFRHLSLTSGGGLDLFLAKYDPEGDLLWIAQATGEENIIGSDLVLDAHGNVFLVGSFAGTISLGETTLESAGAEDVFVAQYTREGKFVWAERVGGEGADFGTAIALNRRGDLYIGGQFRSTVTFGPQTIASTGDRDAFLARIRVFPRGADGDPDAPK